MLRRLIIGAALMAAACTEAPSLRGADVAEEIDRRIRFYSGKVERRPRLYPVHVQLATAYFDKARETSDPRWLAEARRSVDRSIAIVGTYEAFVMLARIANHAHRFEDAIRWARRVNTEAVKAAGMDRVLIPILVEAHIALGQDEDARALLPPEGTPPADFFTAAALGQWWSSQARYAEAVNAFDAAAVLAKAAREPRAATWARAMAAGALVDAGRPDLARPRLESLRRTDASDALVRLHDAECLEAERRPAEALAVYEGLIEDRPSDPELHARAWRLARTLRDAARTRRHFDAAERGFRRALDEGEVYTLGALAQLYVDAGVHLDEAAALAGRNLIFRRDREARVLAERTRNSERSPRSHLPWSESRCRPAPSDPSGSIRPSIGCYETITSFHSRRRSSTSCACSYGITDASCRRSNCFARSGPTPSSMKRT